MIIGNHKSNESKGRFFLTHLSILGYNFPNNLIGGERMPRLVRVYSSTGFYHVMMRGNERKKIFHDEEDRERFLFILEKMKKEKEYKVYGYCLMDNHIHLLIKEENDNISRIMKRINTSYAIYFNKKYERVGHVFQDRYKSEVIEKESYLLEVIRYIHKNPVKANIVEEPRQYPWSSFHLYVGKGSYKYDLIERDEMLGMFSEDQDKAVALMIEHTNRIDTKYFLDEEIKENEEKEIHDIIAEFLNKQRADYKEMRNNKILRNQLIKELKEKTNSPIRMIAKILDVDRNIVQRLK